MFHKSLGILFPVSLLALAAQASIITETIGKRATIKNVIIQLFEWNWDSIAAECTNFIGPVGYGYVQVSPPNEHLQGSQWWTDYQPVSYTLTSKRGNRQQFKNMIDTCGAAGVKVIVDAVLNHMAGVESGTGTAGTSFSHYNYPGVYQYQDFHHCGLSSGDDISDYSNRDQVQKCELVNLADLATETEYVRATTAKYLNDLYSLGVDGWRLDAAKHIASGDLGNILSRVSKVSYITQEVIYGSGEPIQPSEYVSNGNVQEFRYVWALKDAFLSSGIAGLQNLDNRGWIAGIDANAYVANHDTERGGDSLNYNSPSNTYTLAMVYSLAYPWGTPTILSSYSFGNKDDGSPNNGYGTCNGSSGSGGWLCQHRWNPVAGLVGFHNNVGGDTLNNWQTGNNQQIAFGRGTSGFVIINNSDSSWSRSFTTSLPAGTYCDVYAGPKSGSNCAGASYTVSGGSVTVNVGARQACALHTGALAGSAGTTTAGTTTTPTGTITSGTTTSTAAPTTTSASSGVTITFAFTAYTNFGQNIYVTGSIPQLGSWNPSAGVALSALTYPVWRGTVTIPAGTTFSFKYTKVQGSTVIWESGADRTTTVSQSMTFYDTWK